jgi:WD40 repeat protein
MTSKRTPAASPAVAVTETPAKAKKPKEAAAPAVAAAEATSKPAKAKKTPQAKAASPAPADAPAEAPAPAPQPAPAPAPTAPSPKAAKPQKAAPAPSPATISGALRARHTLDLGLEKVLAAAARPGHPEVVVANRTGRVLALHSLSGERLREYKGHTSFVSALSFSADGAQLISGGTDKTMRAWDAQSAEYDHDMSGILHGSPRATTMMGQMMRSARPGHGMTVLCLTHGSHDLIGSGGQDRCAKIWRGPQLLHTFDFHDGPVTAVCFRPGAETLLSASEDRFLRLWDHLDGRMVHKYSGHTAPVRAALWLDAQRILSADDAGAIILWDADSESITARAQLPSGVRAFAANHTSDVVFAGTESGVLAALHIGRSDITISHQHPAHPDTIRAIALDEASRVLVSGGHDGSVRIWDVI